MYRLALVLPFLAALPSLADAQGFTPEEAVKRMKLPEGFSVRCVAHEPMIRQPTSMSFDNRGRMWVLQYLQYPNYAGLKALKQDQYLRTIWDKVPEPPPHGPKGADKITILFDPDENGVFKKSKDFVTGLNIASGFCIANGGVYVTQPPYLLFYADKDEDDVPDGDPEVLLSGFGMDDTHSLANSLQIGPDGWLYGAAGSTSTCKIKNLTHPKDAVVEFQQGIWRFHPKTKRFELFSEGGGNTYGLDFDKNGQAIAGTNYGGVACLHQMQGAYYVKGFSKHGPLHNPHTYGYFEHVPYTGFKGGHVTCGGIIYQADAYPKEFRDQYIAANILSNGIYWHKLEPVKSSFKASHGGELIEANDPWFRPVDMLQGPDGCVYVVDFYDRRAAHLDPVDNWDKTNGRIYRIEYKGGPKYPTFDLRKKTTAELLELLKHSNVWYRREARELLSMKQLDRPSTEKAYHQLTDELGEPALEGLWALASTSGFDESVARVCFQHRDEYVRAWGVRLLGDTKTIRDTATKAALEKLALNEKSPIVRAQLACTAKRLPIADAKAIVWGLLSPRLDPVDPQIMLLIWWAIEATFADEPATWMQTLEEGTVRCKPAHPALLDRAIRRLVSLDKPESVKLLQHLIDDLRAEPADGFKAVAPLILGPLDHAITSAITPTAKQLEPALVRLAETHTGDTSVTRLLVRLGNAAAIETVRKRATLPNATDAERLPMIDLLRQVRDPATKEPFLSLLGEKRSDAVKIAVLAALEGYDDPKIGETVLAAYPGYSAGVKKRAVQLLLARSTWALDLLKRLEKGTFPKTDLTVDQARIAIGLGDKAVTELVEKQFGKIAPATAGEKQARISWLNAQIPREKGADVARGKVLFTKHCAACHQFHGEGGKVGPDLTTADRKNRGYMLAQIVDPSGYIRPEFVVQNVLTTDERKVLGIAKEVGESVELSNFIDNKVVTTVIAKKDIADIKPSAISLMPEKILDTLSDAEIADLFAFLVSDAATTPKANAPGSPKAKLKVALLSGSFEYKSDDSLAGLKKHLEANYPVECVLISAKAEKDTMLAGIENLEKCDVAIFFTRRLQIDGEALDAVKKYVKSGKPIVGIRTASHGFQKWLEMDKEILGGDYQGHFGKGIADVNILEKQKDHPILKGVAAFKTNGSLYKNPNVAADVVVLLQGSMGKESEPMAWTREKDGRRVFYTSLGHPDDFKDENFTRLIVNALAWTTKTELKPTK
ncbi:MAG: hypothetical protein C0467_03710 [Planctomycetaceae bacterium]|nr:hypothetical protein [Planctomycetaceae bacterium]